MCRDGHRVVYESIWFRAVLYSTLYSTVMFETLHIPTSFLDDDPSTWCNSESFLKAQKLVQGLTVVNDRAERGVALTQNFSKKLTKDEEELQFLLQVVTEHRKLFPKSRKSTVLATPTDLNN